MSQNRTIDYIGVFKNSRVVIFIIDCMRLEEQAKYFPEDLFRERAWISEKNGRMKILNSAAKCSRNPKTFSGNIRCPMHLSVPQNYWRIGNA